MPGAHGRELILRGAMLRVDTAGGIARTVLEQCFASPYDEPLALFYQLPLPSEGTVAFASRLGLRASPARSIAARPLAAASLPRQPGVVADRIGSRVKRRPVAARSAFAIAGAPTISAVSPAPAGGTSRRSRMAISTRGASVIRGIA